MHRYKKLYCYKLTIDNGKDNSRGFICGAIAKNYNISITNCYADGNEPLFATSIIPDNNFKVDTYSGIKNTSFFANPESAWILNTTNGTVANSKVWSHNGTNPIFADATNGAIVKAGAIDEKPKRTLKETKYWLPISSILLSMQTQ